MLFRSKWRRQEVEEKLEALVNRELVPLNRKP